MRNRRVMVIPFWARRSCGRRQLIMRRTGRLLLRKTAAHAELWLEIIVRRETDFGVSSRKDFNPMKTFTLDEAQSLLPVLEALLKRAIDGKRAAEEVETELSDLSRRIY